MEPSSPTDSHDLSVFARQLLDRAEREASVACLRDEISCFHLARGDVVGLFAEVVRVARDANVVGSFLAALGEWEFVAGRVTFLGANALHWSVIGGDVNQVRTLIRHGFDVNAKLLEHDEVSDDGIDVLRTRYRAPVVRYLESFSAVESPALVIALESGYEEMASYLIYVGADILAVNDGISIAKLCESSDIAKVQYESALLSRQIQESMGVISENSGGLARKSGRASKFSV